MQRKRMSNFIYFVKSLKLQQVTKSFPGMKFFIFLYIFQRIQYLELQEFFVVTYIHHIRATSQVSISQVATSQYSISQGLGPLRRRRLQYGAEHCGQDRLGDRAPRLEHAGGRALQLGQTCEVCAWEITDLVSCHLGKYSWEVTACEMPLGKNLTSNLI